MKNILDNYCNENSPNSCYFDVPKISFRETVISKSSPTSQVSSLTYLWHMPVHFHGLIKIDPKVTSAYRRRDQTHCQLGGPWSWSRSSCSGEEMIRYFGFNQALCHLTFVHLSHLFVWWNQCIFYTYFVDGENMYPMIYRAYEYYYYIALFGLIVNKSFITIKLSDK